MKKTTSVLCAALLLVGTLMLASPDTSEAGGCYSSGYSYQSPSYSSHSYSYNRGNSHRSSYSSHRNYYSSRNYSSYSRSYQPRYRSSYSRSSYSCRPTYRSYSYRSHCY